MDKLIEIRLAGRRIKNPSVTIDKSQSAVVEFFNHKVIALGSGTANSTEGASIVLSFTLETDRNGFHNQKVFSSIVSQTSWSTTVNV